MKYHGIIFDFNGVLWWDSHLHEKTWIEYSTQLRGYPVTPDELVRVFHGRTNKHNLEYLLGRPLDGEELNTLTQCRESIYRKLCLQQREKFELSPGSKQLLNFLVEHDVPRTIATSSEAVNLRFFKDHLGLAKWFDEELIVYDDGEIRGKPAPDMYIQAASNIELEPSQCIVIEDALSGIDAAHSAGIGMILGLGPGSMHELLRATKKVEAVITTLEEFPKNLLFLRY